MSSCGHLREQKHAEQTCSSTLLSSLLLLKSSQILRAVMAAHMMAFANLQVSLGLLTTHGFLSQGYYRRGDAHYALGKYKDALKDFKSAARLAPRDPDLRKKLTACEKEVKRIRFEEALATPVSHN